MDKFWQFNNLSADEGELLLYGNIASQKPWWNDEAEGIYPKQFADDLKSLGNISNLTVRLNSNGGDVFAAQAIYTQLKSHSANVTAVIDGIAASAATIIMSAADTIKAPSNAMIMIHDPLLMLWGNYNSEDMIKMMDVLASVKDSIVNAYVAKTGLDKANLAEMMKNETWMTGSEAKDKGFVDEIMFEENIEATYTNDGRFFVVNSIAHDMRKFHTLPTLPVMQPVKNTTLPITPVIPKNQETEGEFELEIKNLDELKLKFPDLCNQLVNQAQTDERNRLKAIDEISATIEQSLVAKAKYDEPMTAQALAFEALKADASKGTNFQNARQQELETANQVPAAAVPPVNNANEVNEDILNKIANAANQKRTKGVTQ